MENHNNQTNQEAEAVKLPAETGGGENAADVKQLIEAAEERGYVRGRKEAAEQIISKPALFEEIHQRCAPVQASPLLSPQRISIWDLP